MDNQLKVLTDKTIKYIEESNHFKKYKLHHTRWHINDITIERSYSGNWLRVYKDNREVFLVSSHSNDDLKKPLFDSIVRAIDKKEVQIKTKLIEEF